MKVADLVKYESAWTKTNPWMVYDPRYGVVVEIGKFTGNNNCIVLWGDGKMLPENNKNLKVINESR